MISSGPLAGLLLPQVRAEALAGLSAAPDLDRLLAGIIAGARAEWPDVSLAEAVFVPYLARRVPAGPDPVGALLGLAAPDLYLACACAQGDEGAIALLRTHHRPKIRAALGALGLSAAQIDDVEQMVLRRLLCAEPGEAPQIDRYSGHGELRGWLCIVAVREARQAVRREQRELVLCEDALLDLIGADVGSELGYLKQEYRDEFRAAFAIAVQSLSPRERNVLRSQLLGRLTTVQIGALCGVNARTVKRWLADIRDQLLHRTRETLMARLRMTPSEVDSVIRLIRSDMDMSIAHMLEDGTPPAA